MDASQAGPRDTPARPSGELGGEPGGPQAPPPTGCPEVVPAVNSGGVA